MIRKNTAYILAILGIILFWSGLTGNTSYAVGTSIVGLSMFFSGYFMLRSKKGYGTEKMP